MAELMKHQVEYQRLRQRWLAWCNTDIGKLFVAYERTRDAAQAADHRFEMTDKGEATARQAAQAAKPARKAFLKAIGFDEDADVS